MKYFRALSFTGFVFGFAGWLYIAVNAWVHPETLSWQLTHLTPWLREDTFGIICFAVAIISFFAWNILREIKS